MSKSSASLLMTGGRPSDSDAAGPSGAQSAMDYVDTSEDSSDSCDSFISVTSSPIPTSSAAALLRQTEAAAAAAAAAAKETANVDVVPEVRLSQPAPPPPPPPPVQLLAPAGLPASRPMNPTRPSGFSIEDIMRR